MSAGSCAPISYMFVPKKVKHKKTFRMKRKNMESRGTELNFGTYGLKSLGDVWLTGRQIEAARRAIIRYLRKRGKMWIRIFPTIPVTSKGEGMKMGKGKGAVDHYIFPLKPGRIIFEISGISIEKAKEAFSRATDKLPIKTKMIVSDEIKDTN